MNKLAIFLDKDINQDNINKVREIANSYIEDGYTTAIVSLNSFSTLKEKYDTKDDVDTSFDYFITPQDERVFSINNLIVDAMIEIGIKPLNTVVVLSERISGTPLVYLKLDIHKGAF